MSQSVLQGRAPKKQRSGARDAVDSATMARVKKELLDRRLLPFISENRIHVVPPAVVTPSEALRGLGLIDEALDAVF